MQIEISMLCWSQTQTVFQTKGIIMLFLLRKKTQSGKILANNVCACKLVSQLLLREGVKTGKKMFCHVNSPSKW